VNANKPAKPPARGSPSRSVFDAKDALDSFETFRGIERVSPSEPAAARRAAGRGRLNYVTFGFRTCSYWVKANMRKTMLQSIGISVGRLKPELQTLQFPQFESLSAGLIFPLAGAVLTLHFIRQSGKKFGFMQFPPPQLTFLMCRTRQWCWAPLWRALAHLAGERTL